MKAAGEGGGRSLTYSRQRDGGLPCVPETRESEVKRPSTRHHLPGASLPLLAFLHFPFGGCRGFTGDARTVISGVKRSLSPSREMNFLNLFN